MTEEMPVDPQKKDPDAYYAGHVEVTNPVPMEGDADGGLGMSPDENAKNDYYTFNSMARFAPNPNPPVRAGQGRPGQQPDKPQVPGQKPPDRYQKTEQL